MNASRYLVIGSNSFSGASFVAHVLARGHEVVGVSRSPEPIPAFLPYRWGDASRFQFHQIDLNVDLPRLVRLVAEFQPDYVVNFAAQGMVAQSWERPLDWYRTNLLAMAALHEELRKFPFIKKFIQASTPEVYGNTTGLVKEDAPFNPSTPYAVSKAACDMNLFAYHRAYGFPVALTRSANVCGPAQALYRIVPRTIFCILSGEKLRLEGGGTSVRSFIHIEDVCEGTRRVAELAKPGSVFHLSTERRVSIRALVELICQRLGADFDKYVEVAPARLAQDAAYLLDSSRARAELGWEPTRDLETIIDDTARWMRQWWEDLKQAPRAYIHKP
ncbi:MAG: GDP-mannose 4,6-dehydratase [Kiritimatiellae bacterium]|nr:GDP-mannose 4,6-dehydratase [Kiritimatiellia bacterium]MDW8458703.1 GDP-mannose 4,6-dehydratase [Verrucomicrobiota bacterium]